MAEDEDGSDRKARNSHGSNCLYHLLSGNSSEDNKILFLNMLLPLPANNNEGFRKAMLANEDNYGYTAMERAAFYGFNKILTAMLDHYKIYGEKDTPISTKKRTLLHSAADGGKVIVAKSLLNRWRKLLDMQDDRGDTALHKAAKFKHDELVIFLIERGASLTIMNDKGKPPLFDILQVLKAEGALLKRLDVTVSFQKLYSQNLVNREKVILKPLGVLMEKPDRDGKDASQSEISLFSSIIELPQEIVHKFVLHPAAELFIELKLQRIRIFYFVDMLLYFIYVLLYTWLVAKAGVAKTNFTVQSMTHESIGRADYLLSSLTSLFAFVYCLTSALFLLFNFRMLLSKPRDVINSKKGLPSQSQADSKPLDTRINMENIDISKKIPKRRKRGNWSEVLIYLFKCILNLGALILLRLDRCELVNHLIAYVLLSLWCMLFLRFEVFSVGGKYISMLRVVLWNFFKLLFLFSPIFIGFIVAFSIIFENQPLLLLPNGFMTFFTMLAGEFNLRDLFQYKQEGSQCTCDQDGASHLAVTSQLIMTSFVILVSIVVMNLWIGLSVTDTARLEKFGEIYQAIKDIERIQRAEDYAILLKISWLSCLSKQVSLFKKDQNDRKAYEISFSLKNPNIQDLVHQDKSGKENDDWKKKFANFCFLLQKNVAFRAYQLGIVFYDSSLNRKFPVYDYLQKKLENVLVKRDY